MEKAGTRDVNDREREREKIMAKHFRWWILRVKINEISLEHRS